MPFEIKQGDTRPRYEAQLLDNVGEPEEAPIDLTTATNVKFFMRLKTDKTIKVDAGDVDITDDATGMVSYEWQTGDTDTVGVYEAEFVITWSDGGIETVPNKGFKEIEINEDVQPGTA